MSATENFLIARAMSDLTMDMYHGVNRFLGELREEKSLKRQVSLYHHAYEELSKVHDDVVVKYQELINKYNELAGQYEKQYKKTDEVIDKHNALVRKNNDLLKEKKQMSSKYSSLDLHATDLRDLITTAIFNAVKAYEEGRDIKPEELFYDMFDEDDKTNEHIKIFVRTIENNEFDRRQHFDEEIDLKLYRKYVDIIEQTESKNNNKN